MEQLLSKIKASIIGEKESMAAYFKERSSEFVGYLKSLDSVLSKIETVESEYRKKIPPLISEESDLQNRIKEGESKFKSDTARYADIVGNKASQVEGLDKDISTKELKIVSLNGVIEGLNVEKAGLEKSNTELRGQNSVLDRTCRKLTEDEKTLTESLDAKKAELKKTEESIKSNNKDLSRISNDIIIKEKRPKK